MHMLLWFFMSIVIAILIFLSILYYYGLLKTIKIRTGVPKLGSVYIAYKFHQSSYNQVGDACREISYISCDPRVIGVYYDDPKIIAAGKQRYIVGVIIGDKFNGIDVDLEKKFLKNGYKTFWLPEIDNAVIAEFPIISWALIISFTICVFRIFPKLEQFIKKNKLCAHPVIEIWNNVDKVDYMVPLSQQSKFYVDDYYELESKCDYYRNKSKSM